MRRAASLVNRSAILDTQRNATLTGEQIRLQDTEMGSLVTVDLRGAREEYGPGLTLSLLLPNFAAGFREF